LIGAPRASERRFRSSFRPTQRFASSRARVSFGVLLPFLRGERVEGLVGPVVQHLLESCGDLRRLEVLEQVDAGGLHRRVVGAGVEVDRLVVVRRAEHVVEVDAAVEEAPGHVAHQRAQEVADVHRVGERAAVARGPADVGEVFVAAEAEAAEREGLVAVQRVGRAGEHVLDVGGSVHGANSDEVGVATRDQATWQISAQRSIDRSPLQVCCTSTAGLAARNW
jgi:hypothetical protein